MSEEQEGTFGEYLTVLARRRRWLLVPLLVLVPVLAVAVFLLPPVYRSSATILVEQQEIPSELVRASVTSYADQRIQLISQQVMTTRNLSGIIQRFGLYVRERASMPLELVVEEMREAIELEMISAEVIDPRSGRPTEATIAFTLSFENESPDLAQRVTNELVSLFLAKNLQTRTRLAAETSQFLEEEAQRLAARISDLEQQLAAFKQENVGQLPELVQVNLELMDRSERQLLEVEREIRALNQRRIELQAQLAEIRPNAIMFASTGERILTPRDRLRALRAELAGRVANHSDDHPDIRRMRREIASLERAYGTSADTTETERTLREVRAQLVEHRERYSSQHPDVKRLQRRLEQLETAVEAAKGNGNVLLPTSQPDNPAYLQISAQLKGVEAELSALETARGELRARLAEYEARLTKTPQVEREYRALSRDYDNALAKYRETQAKLMEARMSESLERERKGERLSLIEPPLRPEEPVRPNRPLIAVLGLVASLATGLGSAFLAEQSDQSVRDVKDLVRLTNTHPLAVINRIENRRDRRRRWLRRSLVGILLACGSLGALWLVHVAVRPLDVLWFSLLADLSNVPLLRTFWTP